MENAAALVEGGPGKFRQEYTASPGKALSPPSSPGPCADDPRNQWAALHGFLRDGKRLEGFSDFQFVLRLLDRWQINADNLRQEQKIDEGSFGSIFAGRWFDTPVAIKYVDKSCSRNGTDFPKVFRAIRLELGMVTQLKHPNIVEFIGISASFPTEADDNSREFYLGFVSELCSEGSLYIFLHKTSAGKNMDFRSRMRIANEIACGMAYVHQQNIMHRDLSSRNVFLTDGCSVKIGDFGCARKLIGDQYDPSTISGCPAYMAPEQLHGESLLTLKVDVYALGVIMWELLNQQIPWSDLKLHNSRKALSQHVKRGGSLKKTPLERLTWDTFARAGVEAVLNNLLQTEPEKRYSMMHTHERLGMICDAHQQASSAEQERLESLLALFYLKHKISNLTKATDLATKFRGREKDLNAQLRASYKADLTDILLPTVSMTQDDGAELERNSDDYDSLESSMRRFCLKHKPLMLAKIPSLIAECAGAERALTSLFSTADDAEIMSSILNHLDPGSVQTMHT